MKKIMKILLAVTSLIIILVVSITYIDINNSSFTNSIKEQIEKNYQLQDKITYFNQYGNYYIITTQNNIIVLNKEYQEILKEDISKINENKNNYEIIYKNNQLMYENTKRSGNKLTIKYYDITTYKQIKETKLEQQ